MYDTKKLISLIEKEELLWNPNLEDFLNKELKQEIWRKIAKEMTTGWSKNSTELQGKIVADIRKRWVHIRDYYKRECLCTKKYYSKKKSAYVQRRKYVFCDSLKFLDTVLVNAKVEPQKKKTNSSNSAKIKKSSSAPIEEEKLSSAPIEEDPTQDSQEIVCLPDLFFQSPQVKHQLHQSTFESNTDIPSQLMTVIPMSNQDITDDCILTLAKPRRPKTSNSNIPNSNVAFLLSCSQEMEEMTPYQQIEFKSEVLNLIKLIKYPIKMEIS